MIRGRIVLVSFPFDDRSAFKLRPAVCLSEPVGTFHHVTVAFVTSQIPDGLLPTDLLIGADADGFDRTGLHVTSVVRLHRLLTIGVESIMRDLGEVPEPLRPDIDRRLKVLFGL